MSEYVLKLGKPAFLTVETPDGSKRVRIDVFAAYRILVEAEKRPSEADRWQYVLHWLAEQLEVDPSLLAESNAIMFHNAILQLVKKLNEELSQDFFQTASWDDSTPAFQTTT